MQKPTNLKAGDQFRVIRGNDYFDKGEIITLESDDGTIFPFFWSADKSDYYCIPFSKLEPYPKTVRDAQVGDVVVRSRGEHMVLKRLKKTVLLSYSNNFKRMKSTRYTFDELEAHFTLKGAPEVVQTILTMAQIAEKFGVDVSKLKIAKE